MRYSNVCKKLDSTFDHLLQCSRCGICVHQYCYGVVEFGVHWKCYACSSRVQYPVCCICKMVTVGSRYKQQTTMDPCLRCNETEWCHVICAELVIGTRFLNNSRVVNYLLNSLQSQHFNIPMRQSLREHFVASTKIKNLLPTERVVLTTPIKRPQSNNMIHCSICGHPIMGKGIRCWYSTGPPHT